MYERIAFYLLTAITTAAVWIHPYHFSFDGTVHAVNAKLIVDLLLHKCALAEQIFRFNPAIVPNWSGHALMAAAIAAGMSTVAAEKLVFSLCIFVPALGFRRLLRTLGGDMALSWPVLAVTLNYFLLGGSYNYTLGIGISFWICAFLHQHRYKHSATFYLLLVSLLVAAWLSHIVAFLFAGFLLLLIEMVILRDSWQNTLIRYLRDNIGIALCFLPALVLTTIYILTPYKELGVDYSQDRATWLNILAIFSLTDFLPYYTTEALKAMALFWGLSLLSLGSIAWAFLAKDIERGRAAILLMGAVTLWTMSLFSQISIKGGWLLDMRLHMLGWYIVFLAVALLKLDKMQQGLFVGLSVGISLANILLFTEQNAQSSALMNGIKTQMPAIEEKSVVLTLEMPPTLKFSPSTHSISGYVLADKQCVIDLNNYEAFFDYFPLRFKNEEAINHVYRAMAFNAESQSYIPDMVNLTRFDPQAFKKLSGLPVDYIFLVGETTDIEPYAKEGGQIHLDYYHRHRDAYLKDLQQNLFDQYKLISGFTHENRDFFRVFKVWGTDYKE